MRVEKIAAVTLRVADMRRSVRFYRDVLGMEIVFEGEDAFFSSLRAKDGSAPILNLEQGHSVPGWGRMSVNRPQDIENDAAMAFFGGEEGDADESQG
jgi:catechol 2,3-dioxygenase-like lactoylglutathione lyase family enzyme